MRTRHVAAGRCDRRPVLWRNLWVLGAVQRSRRLHVRQIRSAGFRAAAAAIPKFSILQTASRVTHSLEDSCQQMILCFYVLECFPMHSMIPCMHVFHWISLITAVCHVSTLLYDIHQSKILSFVRILQGIFTMERVQFSVMDVQHPNLREMAACSHAHPP